MFQYGSLEADLYCQRQSLKSERRRDSITVIRSTVSEDKMETVIRPRTARNGGSKR